MHVVGQYDPGVDVEWRAGSDVAYGGAEGVDVGYFRFERRSCRITVKK
jgi:hypothetical protein